MMNRCKAGLVALALTLLSPLALAEDSPVGVWKNIDDVTHQAKALIQISEDNGELSGKIVKLLHRPEAVCDKCSGALKDRPVMGMTILWGLKKEGGAWSGGKILDPSSGKVYSARMKLLDAGRKLEVRGFLGISLLGRSQIWERQ